MSSRRASVKLSTPISESSPPPPLEPEPSDASPTLSYVPQFPGDFPQPHSYPPPSEMVFRNYHGLRVAAKVWGQRPVRGRAREDWIRIIALHGWLDNAATWDHMAPHLLSHALRYFPSHRITLVCLDLPGHGLADHRHRQVEYADWRNIADVESVREQLGWRRFHLLGHSMGGGISSLYAGTFPERVQGVVLVDNAGMWWRPEREHPEYLRSWVRDVKRAGAKRKPLYPTEHDALVARAKGSRIPLTYEGARALVSRGLMEVEIEGEGGEEEEKPARSRYVLKTGGEQELTQGSQKRKGSLASTLKRGASEDDEDDEGEDPSDGKYEKKIWYTWRTDPGLTMARGTLWSESIVNEFSRRIRCPVMMILAASGHWVSSLVDPKASEERTAARLAIPCGGKARIVLIEGSHHLHLESRHRECAELAADFLLNRGGARDALGSAGEDVAADPAREVARQLGAEFLERMQAKARAKL